MGVTNAALNIQYSSRMKEVRNASHTFSHSLGQFNATISSHVAVRGLAHVSPLQPPNQPTTRRTPARDATSAPLS